MWERKSLDVWSDLKSSFSKKVRTRVEPILSRGDRKLKHQWKTSTSAREREHMTLVLNEVIGGDRESASHCAATNGNQILNHFDGSAHHWNEISAQWGLRNHGRPDAWTARTSPRAINGRESNVRCRSVFQKHFGRATVGSLGDTTERRQFVVRPSTLTLRCCVEQCALPLEFVHPVRSWGPFLSGADPRNHRTNSSDVAHTKMSLQSFILIGNKTPRTPPSLQACLWSPRVTVVGAMSSCPRVLCPRRVWKYEVRGQDRPAGIIGLITPAVAEVWTAGAISPNDHRKLFEFLLTLQLFLRWLRGPAFDKNGPEGIQYPTHLISAKLPLANYP